MTVLYITQNGVTEPIGRSQIAPYLLGLAEHGHSIHVLSAEKPGHADLVDQYQSVFNAAGIRWTRLRYHNKPALVSSLYDLFRMYFVARRIVRNEGVWLVHCRSFPPAIIGHHLKRAFGCKFLFDFRDFYADGGLVNKPFKFVYRYLKRLEGPMIRNADKVVCLTRRASQILSEWYLRDDQDQKSRFEVIPCCADFEHFSPERVTPTQAEAARKRASVSPDAFVLLYLGSLGPDYMLPQMLQLFRELRSLRPNAVFMFVCNNGRELVESECRAQRVPKAAVRYVSVDRCEVPAFISIADAAVVFIRPDLSKAGCSPTKLAELFACNVPVIANSGVGDMDNIIDLERNASVVIDNFERAAMRSALVKFLDYKDRHRIDIRGNSRDLAVDRGVLLYDSVYADLRRGIKEE